MIYYGHLQSLQLQNKIKWFCLLDAELPICSMTINNDYKLNFLKNPYHHQLC